MEALPVSHAQSGKALRAFSLSTDMRALKKIISTRIHAIRKRPMLDKDYQAVQEGIAWAKNADPCAILRECTVEGDTVQNRTLQSAEIVAFNNHADLHLHAFMGSAFHMTRNGYSAANAIFPLMVDAPALGLTQIKRDMSIYHYDEAFLNILGMSILYAMAAERMPQPMRYATVIIPVLPGMYYKGHMEPNDVQPDDIGLDRRHSYNRTSASKKDRTSRHSPGDGYMPFFITLGQAFTSDHAYDIESDTYHALTGLFGRPKEDALLRRICLAYIDDMAFPLTAPDLMRVNNIIGGLVDMYQDPAFCLNSDQQPDATPAPPRPSMPH